ncbi:STAS domain-containing protein [Parabacteroides chinchillae]|uniref:Anti-sigma factor antagonist n=1 Tax=Parabacteroides chinchillae TaxID=871327 RepID=A0A8G2BV31_9BACT|nr:STAS domain-containing protein [Parabacteroides chinchillae]SEF66682.1 anti-sigma B factor antagonist/stage II sporulation protein AA (anti-sigma F factor antagonist) [Parabacteroides chinchillae]
MNGNMKVTVTEGPEVVVIVSGRLDTNSSADFEKTIEPVLNGTALKVKVDCSDLKYISSSGLRVFLLLQKKISHRNGVLRLYGLNDDIREVFDVTGFSALFLIE